MEPRTMTADELRALWRRTCVEPDMVTRWEQAARRAQMEMRLAFLRGLLGR